jgi:hypothetical protein
LASSGWIAVAGVALGGVLAAGSALLQTFVQGRSERANRKRQQVAERHAELKQIYVRYQLAVDRLENAIREMSETRRSVISPPGGSAAGEAQSDEAFELAQREYDEACEILKLLAPAGTWEVALQQRELYNGFAREGLDGTFDFGTSHEAIGEAAGPVLAAMRRDLGTLDRPDIA